MTRCREGGCREHIVAAVSRNAQRLVTIRRSGRICRGRHPVPRRLSLMPTIVSWRVPDAENPAKHSIQSSDAHPRLFFPVRLAAPAALHPCRPRSDRTAARAAGPDCRTQGHRQHADVVGPLPGLAVCRGGDADARRLETAATVGDGGLSPVAVRAADRGAGASGRLVESAAPERQQPGTPGIRAAFRTAHDAAGAAQY